MKIIIHRGTHEIGGSCVEIRSKKSRILIDIGMPLVKKAEIDLILGNMKIRPVPSW